MLIRSLNAQIPFGANPPTRYRKHSGTGPIP
jgi:hypothetical protein